MIQIHFNKIRKISLTNNFIKINYQLYKLIKFQKIKFKIKIKICIIKIMNKIKTQK